jgi:hypothetical protein
MKNKYPVILLQFAAVFIIALSSCKKNPSPAPPPAVTDAKPVSLGLFEYVSGNNNRIFIPISKVGTSTVNYDEIFDTGSTGLTIGAKGIIDSNLITKSRIVVTGDSVISNGVTITSQTSIMEYGNATSSTTLYGNLAYADITIPNESGDGLTIKRVPMFLYYKIVEKENGTTTNTIYGSHAGDIFGVGPGVSYTNSTIASPLSYYTPGTGLKSGFKLALLNNASFSTKGTYVPNLLTVGLTQADLTSSNFIMHPLTNAGVGGYSPNIPGTITYNGKTIAVQLLFDTGTPAITIIEDKTASIGPLPVNTTVTVTTNKGFTYTYNTTSTTNLTSVQNPNNTQDFRTIFSIDFFIANETLTDYSGHQIGLKNN